MSHFAPDEYQNEVIEYGCAEAGNTSLTALEQQLKSLLPDSLEYALHARDTSGDAAHAIAEIAKTNHAAFICT
jgi:hypothetical protein